MRRNLAVAGDILGRQSFFKWGSNSNISSVRHYRSSSYDVYLRLVTRRPSSTLANHNKKNDTSSKSQAPSTHPLPIHFLKECDPKNFDPRTFQRNDVDFDIIDGKPPPRRAMIRSKNEGKTASSEMPSSFPFSEDWIISQAERWRADANDFDDYSLMSEDIDKCGTASSVPISKGTNQLLTSENQIKRILWSNWTEDIIRDPKTSPILFNYNNLNKNNMSEQRRLQLALYQYGLVLVRETPTYTESLSEHDMNKSIKKIQQCAKGDNSSSSAESAILHLASIVGYHPLHTLYGSGVWSTSSYSSFYNKKDDVEYDNESSSSSTSSNASTADSSYGSTSLPLHTDMTYVNTPPGVQIFLMIQPAAASDAGNKSKEMVPKGQSVYLDGFAAARQLLCENPEAFRILASTSRRYRCIDADLGWHLEASGPIIETVLPCGLDGWENSPVKLIRHNDLDRLPDLPPYLSNVGTMIHQEDHDQFYHNLQKAHEAWNDILRRDSMRFVINLQAGDCLLVANQRCLHGRFAFETSKYPRVIMGCYVGMDELLSKWRKIGLQGL